MNIFKKLVTAGIHSFGREIVTRAEYTRLTERSEELTRCGASLREYEFLRGLPHESAAIVLSLLPASSAQFRQDLFVLAELGFKRDGFFVEFGATNGVEFSNTWLLEKQFGWNGILAEPATLWHTDLQKNRACSIDERCVWSTSGESLIFSEVESIPALSTIHSFSGDDMHRTRREKQRQYTVKTISLIDLLREHQAPREIDYISIDTEGSELQILSAFDFDAYRFRVITVEHNFTPNREKLRELLESKGYSRKLESISFVDDWYVQTNGATLLHVGPV